MLPSLNFPKELFRIQKEFSRPIWFIAPLVYKDSFLEQFDYYTSNNNIYSFTSSNVEYLVIFADHNNENLIVVSDSGIVDSINKMINSESFIDSDTILNLLFFINDPITWN